jgi:hypothetical protein
MQFISDDNIKKVILNTSRKFLRMNERLLGELGFDLDDLNSLGNTWALVFLKSLTRKQRQKPLQEKGKLFHNFVTQRQQLLLQTSVDKFDIRHKKGGVSFSDMAVFNSSDAADISIDSIIDIRHHTDDTPESILMDRETVSEFGTIKDSDVNWSTDNKKSLIELREKVVDNLEIIGENIKFNADEPVKTIKALNSKRRSINRQLANLSRKIYDSRTNSKTVYKSLKKLLNEDPVKYTEVLCHVATTKDVPLSVRTTARIYCKRNKIDYIGWAEKKLSENASLREHIVL